MQDSGPGRLFQGLAALEAAPSGARLDGPPLQSLADIARVHGRDILRETVGKQVSPALVLAVISVESGGRATAESGAGAQGLMQLIPATAERFGVSDSFDAAQNIRGGVAYLDWLMGEFDGDPLLALAGYNAGEGAVRTHAGVPPYAETRAYVPKVLAAWKVARGLCLTPPELMTDGCVFAVQGEMP
jgi:soluble lytic murein transglycosylase-like protein